MENAIAIREQVNNAIDSIRTSELPIVPRFEKWADTLELAESISKSATVDMVEAIGIDDPEEFYKELVALSLYPEDWKKPRSVWNAVSSGKGPYTVQGGFVEYKHSKTQVRFTFIKLAALCYNYLEQKKARAEKVLQENIKQAKLYISVLHDCQDVEKVQSYIDSALVRIAELPTEEQDKLANDLFCAIMNKDALYIKSAPVHVGKGMKSNNAVSAYDDCFFRLYSFECLPCYEEQEQAFDESAYDKMYSTYADSLARVLKLNRLAAVEQAENAAKRHDLEVLQRKVQELSDRNAELSALNNAFLNALCRIAESAGKKHRKIAEYAEAMEGILAEYKKVVK